MSEDRTIPGNGAALDGGHVRCARHADMERGAEELRAEQGRAREELAELRGDVREFKHAVLDLKDSVDDFKAALDTFTLGVATRHAAEEATAAQRADRERKLDEAHADLVARRSRSEDEAKWRAGVDAAVKAVGDRRAWKSETRGAVDWIKAAAAVLAALLLGWGILRGGLAPAPAAPPAVVHVVTPASPAATPTTSPAAAPAATPVTHAGGAP